MDTDVTDRLASLQSNIGQLNFGAYSVNACRWKKDQFVETDSQMDFTAESQTAHSKFPYRAKWTITNRLTDSGFEYVDVSPISYTLLDAQGKEGPWQTLPITDQDRLRIAVRLNQPETVSVLMAKGVDPNKDPADNLAALAAQVNGAPELALLLAKGVDINRNPTGRSWSMDSAILARDPVVLEEMLTGKPSLANDSSFDVYEILTSSLPRTEAYADMLGSHGPVDDEAAFVRKLKLLVATKYDLNAADSKSGKTAIILAVEAHFSTKLIQALLDAGADPNKKNAAGKSAVDIAADTSQLPVLRLLDTRHRYADLLKGYKIPANSPLVGTWTSGEDMYLTLSADGTGNLASMFACPLTWKEASGVAHIEFHAVMANKSNMGFAGSAKLGAGKEALLLEIDWPTGHQQETLHRDKSQ